MDNPGKSPCGSVSGNTEGEPISAGHYSSDPARQTPRRRINMLPQTNKSPCGSVSSNTEGEPISVGRHSRDPARQTPRRRTIQNEGVEGSLNFRQVRKRSVNKSRSREPSMVISMTTRSRQLVRRQDAPQQSRKRYRNRSRSYSRSCTSSSDGASEARGTRHPRCPSPYNNLQYSSVRRLLKRRRSREPSRRSHRTSPMGREDLSSNDQNILHRFLDVLANVKGSSNSKLSLTNVVPEFDPLSKDQTIITWLTKVEE